MDQQQQVEEQDSGFIRNDCNIFQVKDPHAAQPPLSFRGYEQLEPVNETALKRAHSVQDQHDGAVLPIGGLLHMGYFTEEGEIMMDDLAPFPKAAAVGALDQFPLIVREKPPEAHDETSVVGYDFGKYPTEADLYDELTKPPAKEQEMVLAIPASPLIERLLDNDLAAAARINETPLMADLFYNSLNYVRRAWCEKDTRFIQILPYMVYYKVIDGEYHIFTYQRGKGVGEQRLAGGSSIGVGGHINLQDFLSTTAPQAYSPVRLLADGFWSGILRNIEREGDEEINCYDKDGEKSQPITLNAQEHYLRTGEEFGWLYRNSVFFLDYSAGDVEKVHLAMFIGVQVPEHVQIETNEEELHDVGFVPLSKLAHGAGVPSELECWSKSIIDSLYSTQQFTKANSITLPGAAFVRDGKFIAGEHFITPEQLKLVSPAERWKIGTLSGIFSTQYQFYGMNVFMKV